MIHACFESDAVIAGTRLPLLAGPVPPPDEGLARFCVSLELPAQISWATAAPNHFHPSPAADARLEVYF